MAVYRTTFPIAASAQTIWDVLTDFNRYGDWNPSLPSIRGELRPGAELALTLGMPGRPSPKVKARVTQVEACRRLTWDGNAGADWLFAGHREFPVFRVAMGSDGAGSPGNCSSSLETSRRATTKLRLSYARRRPRLSRSPVPPAGRPTVATARSR